MQNAGLDEAQAGIKTAGRNINNLRYADNITLMEESEEELKSLLMKVKEESEIADLKLNIQKTKIIASSPITSWQTDWGTVETFADFIFLGSKMTVMVTEVKSNEILPTSWSNGTEKAMAPHSSTLAWKIPWMEEPGRLQSMG